jgi:pimeloyl-ACP methyl ester carboxylesterase
MMRRLFADDTFWFEWLRTAGHTAYGAADIGECLVTASRIADGDFESWHREWFCRAERVRGEADRSYANGHRVSACRAYLRASNYSRAAEFFLHDATPDPRMLPTWRASRDAFARAAALLPHPAEAVEIPYEGTTLSGYFFRVDDSPEPRPTIIFHGGFDSTLEELYPAAGAAAIERGYHCLAFAGPGQGRAIREQGLPFRPDWEAVVTPVVDVALARPEVDPARLALLGWSYGGLLAPRAAAFEPRIAALIAWDGIYDNFASAREMMPGIEEVIARNPRELDARCHVLMETSTAFRWAFTNGMWVFGVDSPGEMLAAQRDYHLRGIAERITCPTLVCDAADDQFYGGQPRALFDALTCPKSFVSFTADEGAGEHCHVGAHTLFHQRAFDWLDDLFAGADYRPTGASDAA